MTRLLIALSCLIPSTAFAHVGHLGGLAGHDALLLLQLRQQLVRL